MHIPESGTPTGKPREREREIIHEFIFISILIAMFQPSKIIWTAKTGRGCADFKCCTVSEPIGILLSACFMS